MIRHLNDAQPASGGPRPNEHWLWQLPMAVIFAGIYYVAWWLRFDGQLQPTQLSHFVVTLPCVVIVELGVFRWFRIFSEISKGHKETYIHNINNALEFFIWSWHFFLDWD